MATINVENISKTFGSLLAVNNVSFNVEPGEIFGLLGPNGAGKTTSIRIILDIFKPDSGKVSILGGPMNEEKKNKIGYLPEERGLYQDIPLERCLVYLATLKGIEETEAKKRVAEYLERFDLFSSRKKKVKELSKGMQQKAQLITTLIHKPEVVIIDEPFSALDPVNTQMVKDLLREERAKGTTIIMCTHQMHQVEELADRIALIDKGKTVLYGPLNKIRRQFASEAVIVRALQDLPANLSGVTEIIKNNSHTVLHLAPGKTPQEILRVLVEQNISIEQFEIALPTLDEIFIQVVNHAGATK
ncbi:MAG: ABC-2 type transport system ATP-binding protein [Chloroflexi bacterium]|nr:MAG: ABC-2 type transport system ATP-binding protein [Chloroflexota bacterium]MBA4375707.1 sodium ABC transporter [Anaerolinea sp.]